LRRLFLCALLALALVVAGLWISAIPGSTRTLEVIEIRSPVVLATRMLVPLDRGQRGQQKAPLPAEALVVRLAGIDGPTQKDVAAEALAWIRGRLPLGTHVEASFARAGCVPAVPPSPAPQQQPIPDLDPLCVDSARLHLVEVRLPDGYDLAGELLRRGYAQIPDTASHVPARRTRLQSEARAEKRGIWAGQEH
jgi:endonuclease YncB( thermonuclease family)